MKIGLYSMNFGTCADPDVAVEIAQHAEAAGFESVWTGEHVALPRHPPEWFTMPSTLPFLDTVVAMTLLAAHTSTLKIGSGVLELPLHHPVRLAKQLASIDHISHGRLVVGVGVGYLEPEFKAMGVDLSERSERMDEFIGAMRALWTMAEPEFHGRHVDVDGVDAHPRPVQPGGPPVLIGGLSGLARRRAIRSANGWFAYNTTVEWTRDILKVIADETEQIGRPAELGRLELTIIPAGLFDRDVADQYAELGVDRVIVLPRPDAPTDTPHVPVPVDEIRTTIDTISSQLDL
ncbi:MAG TPA: TIGR03619 family F420-dependent LLM class oxidoreductase [Ilumatobacteraceae bacterium]|jgi:probable F420-dependent oxidoreductase